MDGLALFPFESQNFKIYQLITYMFMHGSILHIALNMFGLWMFGSQLENSLKSQRFLIFYFVCGIGSGLISQGAFHVRNKASFEQIDLLMEYATTEDLEAFHTSEHFDEIAWNKAALYMSQSTIRTLQTEEDSIILYEPGSYEGFLAAFKYMNRKGGREAAQRILNPVLEVYKEIYCIPTVGASGAITGIMMAFAMLFPFVKLAFIFLPIPIRAGVFIWIYAGWEMFLGLANFKGDNINHFAHLGGMLLGYILIKYLNKFIH